MSREILFKGKRVDDGDWVEGYYAEQYGAKEIYLKDGVDREYGFDHYHIVPETLCQFTGLCDKNGKRIWENDIVKGGVIHCISFFGILEMHNSLNLVDMTEFLGLI